MGKVAVLMNSENLFSSAEKRGRRTAISLVVCLCVVVAVASIAAYHLVPPLGFVPGVQAAPLDADKIEGVVWAEATLRVCRLLNPDFTYGYAIPFGANLIMAPFVRILGIGLAANRCGMLVFFGFLLAVIVLFARSLSRKWPVVAGCVAILLLSYRSKLGANLSFHILHYQLGFICSLGLLAMILRATRGEDRASFRWELGLFLFAALGGMNGSVTIASSVVPTLFALVCARKQRMIIRQTFAMALLLVVLGTGAGLAAYMLAMRGITESSYFADAGTFTFRGVEEWFSNAAALPAAWTSLFLPNGAAGVDAISLRGFDIAVSLTVATLVALAPAFAFFRRRTLGPACWLVLFWSLPVWVFSLAQFVFFRGAVDRLLWGGLVANFLLLATLFVDFYPALECHRRCTALMAIAAAAILSFWFVRFPATANWSIDRRLVGELESRGLKTGFSSFWNANGNTVLSNGHVVVRPVVFLPDGTIRPMLFQSDKSWYRPDILDAGEDFFVLLSPEEWKALGRAPNRMLRDLARDSFEFQGYRVLAFDGHRLEKILSGKVFVYDFKNIGFAKKCSLSRRSRVIHPGGVSFGPNIALLRGEKCEIRITGKNLGRAKVVSGRFGQAPLEPVFKRKTDSELRFSVTADEDLDSFEVSISNPDGDDGAGDVVMYSEVIDAT